MARLNEWVVLISDSAEGVGDELDCNDAESVTLEYEILDGTTDGVIQVTHSSQAGFAGAWAIVDEIDVSDLLGEISPAVAPCVEVTGLDGPIGFIRAEITTVMTGGADPGVVVRAKRQARAFAGRFK